MTLITLGLILYAVGAFLQIAEEWTARGLTDTSFRALVALTLGPACLAWAAWEREHVLIVIVTGLPAVLGAWAILAKLRDRYRWLR